MSDNPDCLARDLIEMLKLWGLGRTAALDVIKAMSVIATLTPDDAWRSPLAGTGLRIAAEANPLGRQLARDRQ